MKCRKAEILLSKSLDGVLSADEAAALNRHLDGCAGCRSAQAEYGLIMTALGGLTKADPNPHLVQRVAADIRDKAFVNPFLAWKRWGIAALSVSTLFTALLVSGLFFPRPAYQDAEELSRSEELLLKELNPFQETRTLFEAAGAEQKNMMLIFSSLENTDIRRYFP